MAEQEVIPIYDRPWCIYHDEFGIPMDIGKIERYPLDNERFYVRCSDQGHFEVMHKDSFDCVSTPREAIEKFADKAGIPVGSAKRAFLRNFPSEEESVAI